MDGTRQLFLGDATLATGFRLAGFEVFPDARAQDLDRVLQALQNTRTPAFVVIDQVLAASDSRRLQDVRNEGGRILLTQVPSLGAKGPQSSIVDRRIQQLLGANQESS